MSSNKATVGVGITIEVQDDGTYAAVLRDGEGIATTIAVGTEAEVELAARRHVDGNGSPKRFAKCKQQKRGCEPREPRFFLRSDRTHHVDRSERECA